MITSYYLLKKKYPNADYYIFSNNDDRDYRKYIYNLLDNNVKVIDWRSQATFDLVWRGGGGVFFDFKPGKIKDTIVNFFIKLVGIYSYASLFSLYKKLINQGIKADKKVGIGIGLGEYTSSSRKFRDHCLDIASMDAVIVRDDISLSHLKRLKFRGHSSKQTDLAFYEEAWNSTVKPDSYKDFNGKIGFILRDWEFKDISIKENLFQVALTLREEGNDISFFSFDEEGDTNIVSRAHKLNFDVNIWQPEKKPLTEYLSALSSNSLLITSRAHGAIIGNCLRIPSICLAIEPKLVQIHNMLPTSTELIYPPFSHTDFMSLINNMIGDYRRYTNATIKELSRNREMIHKGISQIEQYL